MEDVNRDTDVQLQAAAERAQGPATDMREGKTGGDYTAGGYRPEDSATDRNDVANMLGGGDITDITPSGVTTTSGGGPIYTVPPTTTTYNTDYYTATRTDAAAIDPTTGTYTTTTYTTVVGTMPLDAAEGAVGGAEEDMGDEEDNPDM